MTPFSIVREIPIIVQQDYLYLRNTWDNPIQQTDTLDARAVLDQRRGRTAKVLLIAARALALLGTFLAITSPITLMTFIKLTFWHEVFVLAHNSTRLIFQNESSALTSILQRIMNQLCRLGSTEATNHPITEGTIFPLFWSGVINQCVNRSQNVSELSVEG